MIKERPRPAQWSRLRLQGKLVASRADRSVEWGCRGAGGGARGGEGWAAPSHGNRALSICGPQASLVRTPGSAGSRKKGNARALEDQSISRRPTELGVGEGTTSAQQFFLSRRGVWSGKVGRRDPASPTRQLRVKYIDWNIRRGRVARRHRA